MERKSAYSSDFRHKEVIDVSTGKRLGFITDVDICLETGTVNSVIIPGKRVFFGLFPSKEDIVIPWKSLCKIGDDIILVSTDNNN